MPLSTKDNGLSCLKFDIEQFRERQGDRMSRNPAIRSRRSAIALSVVSLLLILLGSGCGTSTSTPLPPSPPAFPQTKLDGDCFPKFAVSLPVFGPAGSIPRVDLAAHPNLTVTMKEIDQPVLPQGSFTQCGTKITLGQTRVWAYQTTDSSTGAVLGPASWPAVTLVAQRGTTTHVEYVNQLPSFNPSNPSGPGLVQGLLPFDQTVHWADPLKSGCGMSMPSSPTASESGPDKSIGSPGSRSPKAGHIKQVSYTKPSSKPFSLSSMASSMPMGAANAS